MSNIDWTIIVSTISFSNNDIMSRQFTMHPPPWKFDFMFLNFKMLKFQINYEFLWQQKVDLSKATIKWEPTFIGLTKKIRNSQVQIIDVRVSLLDESNFHEVWCRLAKKFLKAFLADFDPLTKTVLIPIYLLTLHMLGHYLSCEVFINVHICLNNIYNVCIQ